MYVKYVYAHRQNFDEKGVAEEWIDMCENNNYIFEVLEETRDKYLLRAKEINSFYKSQAGIWVRKDRCEKLPTGYCGDDVLLPKELFEI